MPITRADLNQRAMQRLIERMRTRRMFSMTGAGLSAWAGYPLWPMLLRRLEQQVPRLHLRKQSGSVICKEGNKSIW